VARVAARRALPPSWLTERRALLGLFALALAIRVVALVQVSRTPYFEVANIDSVAYRHWAERIVTEGWLPAGTFYQSPLYAYFLAVLRTLAGPGEWTPRIVQIVLGSLSPLLLYAIAARLFSTRVGWIAGLLLAVYGPIVLEEITLSKTTLLVVTSLAAFSLYLRGAAAGHIRTLALAGALFGLTVIGVGQWLPTFVGLVLWLPFLAEGLPTATRRQAVAAFVAGALVLLAPMIVWNSARGGGLVLTSGDAGLNLYTGNNERASGLPMSPTGVRDTPQFEEADARRVAEQDVGHALTPAGVVRYWSGRALAWIAANPAAWVALLGKKFQTLWNGYEIPDNYHYVFMRQYWVPLFRVLPTFALVAPLAMIGALWPFWRRRDVTALYVACFGYLATILLFYVRGRYRMQAVPLLIVFAALAVDRLWIALRARQWRAVAALGAGLAVAGWFTNREYCEPPHHHVLSVCLGGDTWFDGEWLKLAEWYRNDGQLDRAIAYANRARECTRPRSVGTIAQWIGELETMRTQELVRAGQRDAAAPHLARAEEHYRWAIKLRYRPGPMQANLATLYAIAGKPAEAATAYEAALRLGMRDGTTVERLARVYVDLGRCADAERLLGDLDRARGLTGPSEQTRALLAACRPS
jgi:4-amino-4-deoxy-L-arabinose transferase-like glycosyltransferase